MKKILVFLCVLILILGAGSTVSATPIFVDNFNTENEGVGVLDYSGFDNWTVTDGTVDLIGNGFYDYFPSNGLYVDMDGSTNNAGLMTSNFSLGAGEYILQFDLAGNQRLPARDAVWVQVDLGSVFLNLFH